MRRLRWTCTFIKLISLSNSTELRFITPLCVKKVRCLHGYFAHFCHERSLFITIYLKYQKQQYILSVKEWIHGKCVGTSSISRNWTESKKHEICKKKCSWPSFSGVGHEPLPHPWICYWQLYYKSWQRIKYNPTSSGNKGRLGLRHKNCNGIFIKRLA